MTSKPKLHVFAVNDGDTTHMISAYSEQDAIAVWTECGGEDPEEYEFSVEQLPDDHVLPITCDDFEPRTVTKTCRAWSRKDGRCILGSSEM